MGVEDNKFDIDALTESQTFLEWFNKTNDEIISKLNRVEVFDGISGDGISASVGTTLSGDGSGILKVEMSGNVTKGITFQDVTINGSLTHSFDGTEIKSVSKFTALEPAGGGTSGFTTGNVVRVDAGHTMGITLAKALTSSDAEAIGLVSSITNKDIFVTTNGKLNFDFSGALVSGTSLESGCVYFLDSTNAGKLTVNEPSTSARVSKPVLVGVTFDTGIVLNYRGQELGISGASAGGNNVIIVEVPSGSAQNFTAGRFISRNSKIFDESSVDPDFFLKAGDPITDQFTKRAVTGGYYYSASADSYEEIPADPPLDDGIKPCRQDIIGLITKVDTDADLLTILVEGTIEKTALDSPPASLNGGVYLKPDQNVQAGRVTTSPTNVRVANVIDDNLIYVKPLISENDLFLDLNDSLLRGGSGGAGVSFGISTVDYAINGSYDIWQRGTSFLGTTAGSGFYFADRWAVVNQIGSTSSAGGTFGVEQKSFTESQAEVLGNPEYYARFTHNLTGLTTGVSGGTPRDMVEVENRLEKSNFNLNQKGVISFYSRASTDIINDGNTMAVRYKQYFDNGAGASGASTTTRLGEIQLTSSWTPQAFAFKVPGLTGSQSVSGTDHYAAIAFEVSGTTFGYIDIAQLQFQKGSNPLTPVKKDSAEVLEKCSVFYQRSYDKEVLDKSETMIEENIPDLTVVDIPVNHSKDYYYNFPVEMRTTPSVTLYSPKSGTTSDGFNRLAQRDMRLTSGTVGPNNAVRESQVNQPTIQVGNTAENGIRFEIVSGAVVGDQISVHYVADADINKNL